MKSPKSILSLAAFLSAQLITALPAGAVAFPEPIARAAKGQLQCYAPDVGKKTCSAIVAFKAGADGNIHTRAVILVSPSPRIIMTGAAIVEPRSGELCGKLSERNFDEATFSDGNDELEPMQAGLLRTVLATSLQTYFGREICGAFVPVGATLLVKPKIDGAPIATNPQQVIWVRPEDNYRVAP